MRNLLLIAYHFPPYSGGSGVHRAARFFQYLPENGWAPYVLTVSRHAYDPDRAGNPNGAPGASDRVIRALAFDAQRHLSIRGRYLKWSAIPDRWSTWLLTAVPAGISAVYRRNIEVIVVTFPIATAVLIGLVLHRITGKPLVVDFRDSMTEDDYPRDATIRSIHRRIEKAAMASGSLFVFTAESALRMYLNRYPELTADKCVVIPNGYDEEDFEGIEPFEDTNRTAAEPFRLVHAGLIYPEERDPRPFFRAISRLKTAGVIDAKILRVDLRASGSEPYYQQLLDELGIEDVVRLLGPLAHKAALKDISTADGLLLFQAASCNHQIPAKAYEYLRVGRPILALTPPEGDTGALLRQSRGATIVDPADEQAIYDALPVFVSSAKAGLHTRPDPQILRHYNRRNHSAVLAQCLDHVVMAGVSQQDRSEYQPRPTAEND